MTRFKPETIQAMLTDPDLFAAIAKEKDVAPANLGTVIRRNGNSINQYAIVRLVADYLKKDMDEIVCEVSEDVEESTTEPQS